MGFGPKPISDPESITVALDRRYTPTRIVKGLLGPVPISLLTYTSPGMFKALASVLGSSTFDIAEVEAVHMLPYVPMLRASSSNPVVVCDWHCIDSEIMRRFSLQCSNPAKRFYARRTAKLLEKTEAQIANLCDLHLVVSEREKRMVEALTSTAPVYVVPNGVRCSDYEYPGEEVASAAGRIKLLFVGTMDYHANIDGVLWFATSILPALLAKYPGLQFVVVGRNPPTEIGRLNGRNIQVVGRVADVRSYYRDCLAAVVPLRVGSGTRIKILEAMAAFTPVVSTSLGAEGLSVVSGEHYLAADSVEQWVSSITMLVENPTLWHKLRDQGRSLVEHSYDWNVIGDNLRKIYEASLAKRKNANCYAVSS